MRTRAGTIIGLGLALAATVTLVVGIPALAGSSGVDKQAAAKSAAQAKASQSAQAPALQPAVPARQFSKAGFRRWTAGRRATVRTLADSDIDRTIRFAATDGHISLPGRDPLYV